MGWDIHGVNPSIRPPGGFLRFSLGLVHSHWSLGRCWVMSCSSSSNAGPRGSRTPYSHDHTVLADTPSWSASHLRGWPIPSLQALISAPVSFDRVILESRNQNPDRLARETGAAMGEIAVVSSLSPSNHAQILNSSKRAGNGIPGYLAVSSAYDTKVSTIYVYTGRSETK